MIGNGHTSTRATMSSAEQWREWSSERVAQWLVSVGFTDYAAIFQANDIAGDILPELTNEVLRDDLNIAAFGHRARILHAVRSLMSEPVADLPPIAPKLSPSPSPVAPPAHQAARAKYELDLIVLHAAPLVIRDGKRLYPMEKLDLEAERRAITNSLLHDIRHKSIHVQFEIATADVLRRVMTASTCRVVHFSGHGLGAKPALCFEDGIGCTHLITPPMLRDLTFAGSVEAPQTQLVFVNSCHSENVATIFLEAGIPHVVAVHSDSLVVDASATMFAKHFYLSLFSGDTVRTAFEVAKAFVRTMPTQKRGVCCCAHLHEPTCAWRKNGSRHSQHDSDGCCCKGDTLSFPHNESSKFLLLGGGGDPAAHDVVLFGNIPNGNLQDHTVMTKAIIPSLHGQFIGRGIETYLLAKSLRDNTVTACIGAPGIGKSSLVIAVAHFAHSRRLFPDGVFYVDLEGQKLSTVRYAIAQCMGIAAAETDEEMFAEIGSRRCLLILDKTEELLDEDETKTQQLLSRMLALAPQLRLLLASRRVPHLPNVTSYSLSLTQLPLHLAVELLCLVAPACPKDAAERLAKLCGCLPLAVRIVGRALSNARTTLTPEQMIAHLEGAEHRLETMKELNQVGQRECIDRCIRSSYSHLDTSLRLAFMALGFFRGSFDVAAIEAILDASADATELSSRSISRSNSSSSSSTASSFFPEYAYAGTRAKLFDDGPESTTGLGSKLAEVDGFSQENDGIFTRESYELLDYASPEESLARTVAVASASAAIKHLHQWSLVEYDAVSKRYRMHNLIQLFAEEEAARLGDGTTSSYDTSTEQLLPVPLGRELVLTWRRRFLRHYCVVLANASHSYRYNGDLRLFDSERANIESAMRIGRLLTMQSIDRMRDARRQQSEQQIEADLDRLNQSVNSSAAEAEAPQAPSPPSQSPSPLFDKSALVDVMVYCNLVTRSRFIFRTRIEPKKRLQILTNCLQMAREARSLYCTCGCVENDPAHLLWDIDDVKHDRPLTILDSIPSYDDPEPSTPCQLSCTCPGIKELISLEVLLLMDLGYAQCDAADWIAGEYYYLEVLRLQRSVLGWGENAQVAEVLNQFGVCLSSGWGCMAFNVWLLRHAERLLNAGLKVRGRVLGETHPDYATSLNNLANFYKNSNPHRIESSRARKNRVFWQQRNSDTASTTSEATTTSSSSSSCNATISRSMGVAATSRVDIESMYRHSLRIRESTLGPVHPHVGQSLNNLALWLVGKTELSQFTAEHSVALNEAEQLYARALAIRRATLGNSSVETAATLNNMGTLKRLKREWKAAESLVHEALRVINRFDADHSPRAARMYINLARVHRDQEKYDEAIKAYETARDIRQKWFPESRDVGYCIEQIGKCMVLQGREDEGRQLEEYGRRMKKLGIAAIPDSSMRTIIDGSGQSIPSGFIFVRLKIASVISLDPIMSRGFNFAGKLLGERGINMKRIDAITCANVRYHGPWPSAFKKRSPPLKSYHEVARDAEIQITAATELALERAKEQCIELLKDVASQFDEFSEQLRLKQVADA